MPSEAQARITINKMLEDAGWRFLPDGSGNRENVILEHRLSGRTFSPNADLGQDFERAPEGFVDYVLLNTDGRAVAVVEAKRESIDPLTAKEQARAYAESSEGEPYLSQQRARSLVLELATRQSGKGLAVLSAGRIGQGFGVAA